MGYILEKGDKSGRQVVKKVGMAPVMRDGVECEFTVALDLDMSHQAVTSKDRTRLFDGRIFEITEATGRSLRDWLDGSGAIAEPASQSVQPAGQSIEPDSAPPTPPPTLATTDQIQHNCPGGSMVWRRSWSFHSRSMPNGSAGCWAPGRPPNAARPRKPFTSN